MIAALASLDVRQGRRNRVVRPAFRPTIARWNVSTTFDVIQPVGVGGLLD